MHMTLRGYEAELYLANRENTDIANKNQISSIQHKVQDQNNTRWYPAYMNAAM